MFIAINRIAPPAGMGPRIEEGFQKASGMKDVPGCLGFEFWRSDDEGHYLVVTRWESEVAFKEWTASDHFKHAHRNTEATEGAASQLLKYSVLRSSG
ncbi:MAG: antibiotic biosynthesis monooxygenase [Thermaerobacterales bacterium]